MVGPRGFRAIGLGFANDWDDTVSYHIRADSFGMYGADTATVLQVEMVKRIEHAVHEFCSN